jgi:uncharacterized damage-inducible protein DinB
MIIDFVRTMYTYNTWANSRIFEMVAQLSPGEFTTPMDTNGNSIRNILVHLLIGLLRKAKIANS